MMQVNLRTLRKSEPAILCKRCGKYGKYVNSELCFGCLQDSRREEQEADFVEHPEKYMHNFPKRFSAWNKEQLLPQYKKLVERHLGDDGLYLEGVQGSGKTCLVTVMGKEYVKRFRREIWFVNAVSLMYEVKGTFDKASRFFNDYDVIMKHAKRPVLVLDDLGSEQSSEYVRQSFYALINHRYLEDLQTFVTSFYSLEQLAARYDASIASRLAEMCKVIDLGDSDLRLKQGERR